MKKKIMKNKVITDPVPLPERTERELEPTVVCSLCNIPTTNDYFSQGSPFNEEVHLCQQCLRLMPLMTFRELLEKRGVKLTVKDPKDTPSLM